MTVQGAASFTDNISPGIAVVDVFLQEATQTMCDKKTRFIFSLRNVLENDSDSLL